MTDELCEHQEKQINPFVVALAVLLPAFLSLAASSATNVSQPHIAGFYGATQYEANTVITCYIISGGIMIPITGYLMRLIGKKPLMNYSIWGFLFGCLCCIFSPNLQTLIVSRIVQGIGSGCILPLAQAILLDVFPPEKRGVAMGLFGIAAMFSPLIGPFIGGYLTDNWSWQWIFIMNIPLCLLSLILVKFFVKDENNETKHKKPKQKFDIIGYISIVVAMGCMQVILDKGQQYNWFDEAWICWLTGICIFSFIFFYVWELEYKNPIIDIRCFKDFNFLFGTIISSFINVILYSTLLLVPMFIQSMLGYSPSMSGLTMFPRAIICLIFLQVAGELSKKIDSRVLASIGFSIITISILMLTQMNPSSSMESIVLPNVLLCIGIPTAFVPITALSFQTLPKSKNADGASLHALFKNVVTAIATSASATYIARQSQTFQNYFVGNLSPHNPVYLTKLHAANVKFSHYYSTYTAQHKAMGSLYKQLLAQARLASFYEIFVILALMMAILIPLTFMLKIKQAKNN